MNEQQTNIEQRLIEYYEGKLEGTVYDEVKAWIASSEENRRMARRVYSLLLAVDVHQVSKEIDTEKALKKVKGRKIAQKKSISWWEWGQRAAAILILPLIGLLIWQQSRMQSASPVAETLEIRTNPGMTTRLHLPDGTYVCLNSGSTLTYPSSFTGDTRSVHLVGEAYFEVAPNTQHRFVVHTPSQSAVEVYGTHFNIEAYPDDPNITTTLTEGKVGFLYKEGTITKRAILDPGQKLIYDTVAPPHFRPFRAVLDRRKNHFRKHTSARSSPHARKALQCRFYSEKHETERQPFYRNLHNPTTGENPEIF